MSSLTFALFPQKFLTILVFLLRVFCGWFVCGVYQLTLTRQNTCRRLLPPAYAGIKYSFDGGTTWASTAKYFNARHVGACDGKIAVWGKTDGESGNRLWYSGDNGVSWHAQTTFAKNFHGVQGITVDRNGKIWVSWNSATVVTPVTTTHSAFSGTFKITARHSSKALDVSNGSASDGANVQQWTANGTAAQQWIITATTDGYYKLVNKGSNKALEVASSGTADGSNVQQWSYTGANHQQWSIEATTDGFYKILNRNGGKALDVSGVSASDGANVHQWTYGGGGNQQWKLEQLSTATAREAGAGAAGSRQTSVFSLPVHPNPAGREVTISLAGFEGESAVQVSMRDMAGRAFLHRQVQPDAREVTLPVDHLPGGVFVVTVQGSKTGKTAKLVITR
jgi:hypothetical protein